MKINEFEKPQLNEGFIDDLIGAEAGETAAGIKSTFNPGMTKRTQMAQDEFIADFVADGIASLQNAVKSGVVVPGTAAPVEKKKTDPVEKKKTTASTDPYEKLKGQIRQLQPKPNAKPLPNNLVVELNGYMEQLAKGSKESGMYAANEILKLANDGYDVSKLTTTWNAKSKAGERFLTQSVYRAITHMLREHRLTWDNLGLRIRLYEGAKNSGVFLSRCSPIPVTTPEFKKMDQVFESIVTELFGNTKPVEGAERISSFMTDWFGKWMHGVDWNKRKPQVQSLINAIETSYPNGNWKDAIKQLARAAYSYSSNGTNIPKGAMNAGTPAKTPAAPTASKVTPKGSIWNNPADAPEEELKAIIKANPKLGQKYNINL